MSETQEQIDHQIISGIMILAGLIGAAVGLLTGSLGWGILAFVGGTFLIRLMIHWPRVD